MYTVTFKINSIGYIAEPQTVINTGLGFTTNFYTVTMEKLQVDEHSLGFGKGFFVVCRRLFLSVVKWFGDFFFEKKNVCSNTVSLIA